MSGRVWVNCAPAYSLGVGEGRSDCGDCAQVRGVGGLCVTAGGCKQSSEQWSWAWDTWGAVGGEQQTHSHYLGWCFSEQCRMAWLHSCLNPGTCPQPQRCVCPDECPGAGQQIVCHGVAGFLSLRCGSCTVAARKGLLLGFPEDGCLIHRWFFTKLLSWCILNQCPSPHPRKVIFV